MKQTIKSTILALLIIALGYGIYVFVQFEVKLHNDVITIAQTELQTRDFLNYTFPKEVGAYNAKVAEITAQKSAK